MYICNITFICSAEDVESRKTHLLDVFIPTVNIPPVKGHALLLVTDVLGDPDFVNHDRSLPLQMEFDSADERSAWMEMILFPALAQYSQTFGEKGLVMVSALDSIS